MPFTLSQAAKEVGRSKSTIFNALKSGRLSARHNEKGDWAIDPAELYRVFAPKDASEPHGEHGRTHVNALIELLQEQLRDAKDRENRLLAMLEAEQQARRELETKLLPAPRGKKEKK